MLNKSACGELDKWHLAMGVTDITGKEVLEFKTWSLCKFRIALHFCKITRIVTIDVSKMSLSPSLIRKMDSSVVKQGCNSFSAYKTPVRVTKAQKTHPW